MKKSMYVKVRIFLLLGFFLLLPFMLFGYNPPAGGSEFHDIGSPSSLGSGASVTDTEALHPGTYNPAAAGTREQFSLSGSYIGFLGPQGGEAGLFGHGANLDVIIPTVFGNILGGASFYHSQMPGMFLGTMAVFRVGYSREIFNNVYIGGNGVLKIGKKDSAGFGIAGDIGFLHTPGDLGFFKNFSWGFAGKELGLPYDPDNGNVEDDRSAVPAPFTPAIGFAFNPLELEEIALRFHGDLSFPTFSSLRIGTGLKFYYQDVFTVKTAMHFDTLQLADPSMADRSLIPSLGIQFNLSNIIASGERNKKPEESRSPGSNNGGVKIEAAAAPLTAGVWAASLGTEILIGELDEDPPRISITYPETQYISPNNDGIQDELTIPIHIEDPSYVQGYTLKIFNHQGNLVREIKNKDPRPENFSFSGAIERIGTAERGISVPENLEWTGLTDAGPLAEDGTYTFHLEAWDTKGNRGKSNSYEVILDNTPPQAEISVYTRDELIFSPNNDGKKDNFPIHQEGTKELHWEGVFYSKDGTKIRDFNFNNSTPLEIEWDGRDFSGELAADGVYRYVLTGWDAAGNKTKEVLNSIILSTADTSVFITTDLGVFSPNTDGEFDILTLYPVVSMSEGLETWVIRIVSKDGRIVKEFTGTEVPDQEYHWNGLGNGKTAPEGEYQAEFALKYTNGNTPQAASRWFLLDTTPPEVEAEISPIPFSPDNDGVDDVLKINLAVTEASSVQSWEVTILDQRRKVFDTISGTGTPREELVWRGYSTQGELVQSAEDYPYILTITDEVENTAAYEGIIPVDVLVIREDGKLKIRISNITFAPNSPDLISEDLEKAEKNIKILSRVAELLKKYSSYSVRIEGHAVRVHWADKERGEREEIEELLPLSSARAETVKAALVDFGISPDRLTTKGLGGREPLVPHKDEENRWKNRRVEFILVK